jgi:phosphoribosylanthranilate isomerase
LSAAYTGVIFAGGPRSLSEEQAGLVLQPVAGGARRVGVMPRISANELAQFGTRLRLDVIQMHGDPSLADVTELRNAWNGLIWAVVRSGDRVDPDVLIDSGSRGTLGGTGKTADWEKVAMLARNRGTGSLILAGGLTPDNVAEAIEIVNPDIVDISSGVESAPGVKDHEKMRAFVTAVQSVSGE